MQHGWKPPAVGCSMEKKVSSIALEVAATPGNNATHEMSSHIQCHKSLLSSVSGHTYFRQEPSFLEKRTPNNFPPISIVARVHLHCDCCENFNSIILLWRQQLWKKITVFWDAVWWNVAIVLEEPVASNFRVLMKWSLGQQVPPKCWRCSTSLVASYPRKQKSSRSLTLTFFPVHK
jgi:hypothetical protein